MPLPETLNGALQATATVTVAELYNEGMASANDPDEWPLAQISEILDHRTCPLCASVDGMVVKVDSPEYRLWRQPSHINCRRVMVYIHRDEQDARETFQAPDPELIRKHGHFHTDPEKHAALRIPAEPAGRHVIVRRVKGPDGKLRTQLEWAPWWKGVSQETKNLVFQARAVKGAEAFEAKLVQLGIRDLSDPGQLERLSYLGLRDKVEDLLPGRAVLGAPDGYGVGVKFVRGVGIQDLAALAAEEVANLPDGFSRKDLLEALHLAARAVDLDQAVVQAHLDDVYAWSVDNRLDGGRLLTVLENRLWGNEPLQNFIPGEIDAELAQRLFAAVTPERLTVHALQRQVTQEVLKRRGQEEITVLLRGDGRGTDHFAEGAILRTLTSFTTELSVASDFTPPGGTILVARVRREHVFVTFETSREFAFPEQLEFVLSVSGGKIPVRAVPVEEATARKIAAQVRAMRRKGQVYTEEKPLWDLRTPEADRFLRTGTPKPYEPVKLMSDEEADRILAERERKKREAAGG